MRRRVGGTPGPCGLPICQTSSRLTTGTRIHKTQGTLDHPRVSPRRGCVDRDHEYLRLSEIPPALVDDPQPIGLVDLFCGCGGLTLGVLEGARRVSRAANLLLAVDYDPLPLSVLRETLGGDPGRCVAADLGSMIEKPRSWEKHGEGLFGPVANKASLLVAGPPCQGHSALNNHTRHDDPRNDLYLAVAQAAAILKPAAVVIENVGGVARDRRSGAARCAAMLEDQGFEVSSRRLDLHRLGVPQRRVRHLLVATKGAAFSWELAEASGRTVEWAIDDLLGVQSEMVFDTPSRPSTENAARIRWLFDNDAFDLPNLLRPTCHQGEHSYVSMYGRLGWDQPAQTITSGYGSMGQGRFVHPLMPRTLTPHEAARIQFMPDFVRFPAAGRTALATMIGNVAPPRLGIVIVQALIGQGLL